METSPSLMAAKALLYTFGVILAAGTLGGVIAKRLKVPDVAVFLLVGIVLGPELLDLIDIRADSAINQIILIFGSCYILFDGGASLRLRVLREVWVTIAIIATVGVLITAAITATAAYLIMGLPLIVAALLGAATASTDPATLVPIFKQIPIKERIAQTVMSESAFNDATGAILTFTVLALALGQGEFSLHGSLVELVKQASLGILIGGIVGFAAALLLAHERYAFLGEFGPVVTLMAVSGAYLAADNYHASGFMAVFTFGIIIGNKESFGFRMAESEALKMEHFVAEMALIMRLMIFVLLGSQVDFALMQKYWAHGVILVLIFMFVARPLTVFVCTLPDRRARWSFKERLFMCWTRETGVIPAALAGLLVGMRAPGAEIIASVTFIAILMTILIQATTTPWLAAKLGVLVEDWQD
ncbi:sodium/proton antiporter, CPA1 family [Fontimonas thermophila]|uniref:Sodium/proton antiporter, CPA1 family n=1 Tax=Fontimonas thermophila TaxID=1076937 RepID=A0A1I2JU23_9GAMM|nr:sodium:proton antiporter [Fontimonas thermophila]SFF58305.1 sodium/proton antiporter, CPA1 family [Fontimonas thermophila]